MGKRERERVFHLYMFFRFIPQALYTACVYLLHTFIYIFRYTIYVKNIIFIEYFEAGAPPCLRGSHVWLSDQGQHVSDRWPEIQGREAGHAPKKMRRKRGYLWEKNHFNNLFFENFEIVEISL